MSSFFIIIDICRFSLNLQDLLVEDVISKMKNIEVQNYIAVMTYDNNDGFSEGMIYKDLLKSDRIRA